MTGQPPLPSSNRSRYSLLAALQRVLSPSGFPYASNDVLFRDAHFGRDALETAEDLLPIRSDIARATISRLAALQGTRTDTRTEEEPGKIHHEYRALSVDGHAVGPRSLEIYRHLAEMWGLIDAGGQVPDEMIYFGTVDATPLYVRLVATYCRAHGNEILSQLYTPLHEPNSISRRIGDSVLAAVDWIARRVERSRLGLLEFQRLNPYGHRYQAWKDGFHSYLHPNGEPANYDGPIASIEVQGLAYDALVFAADLLDDATDEQREWWIRLADGIQAAVMEWFWIPDQRYFAMALDRDRSSGAPRRVKTWSSNAGAALDSRLFDTLPPETRRQCISGVVDRVYSDEFLTPVGIRCTSLRHADVPGYHAYQSSYTVWHKETYDVAKGLRRQGFERLATDLENRLLNAINVTTGAREFLYVMKDNRVDYRATGTPTAGAQEIVGTNIPENDQAWSIAGGLAVKWRRGNPGDPNASRDWQSKLEEQKLLQHPPVRLYRTVSEVEAALPTEYRFWVNTAAGWEREHAYTAAHTPAS